MTLMSPEMEAGPRDGTAGRTTSAVDSRVGVLSPPIGTRPPGSGKRTGGVSRDVPSGVS